MQLVVEKLTEILIYNQIYCIPQNDETCFISLGLIINLLNKYNINDNIYSHTYEKIPITYYRNQLMRTGKHYKYKYTGFINLLLAKK